MARSVTEILEEKRKLEEELEEAFKTEKKEILKKIKSQIEDFKIKPKDLFEDDELKASIKKTSEQKEEEVKAKRQLLVDKAIEAFNGGIRVYKSNDELPKYWFDGKKGAKPDNIEDNNNLVKAVEEII